MTESAAVRSRGSTPGDRRRISSTDPGPFGSGAGTFSTTLTSGLSSLRLLFSAWGLPASLADWAWQQAQEGRSTDEVLFLAQERPEWKTRFIGNERRLAQGLPVLAPEHYLELETAYKNIYRTYGLPPGMYDDPSDFATLIGFDVSAQELERRIFTGVERVNLVPPEVKTVLRTFYGIDDKGLLAYVLDPKRGLAELERQFRAAEVGGAALFTGFDITRARAEELAQRGIDFERASEGFQQARALARAQERQAFGSGLPIGSEELQSLVFFGDVGVAERLRQRRAASLGGIGAGVSGAVTGQQGALGLRSVRS